MIGLQNNPQIIQSKRGGERGNQSQFYHFFQLIIIVVSLPDLTDIYYPKTIIKIICKSGAPV